MYYVRSPLAVVHILSAQSRKTGSGRRPPLRMNHFFVATHQRSLACYLILKIVRRMFSGDGEFARGSAARGIHPFPVPLGFGAMERALKLRKAVQQYCRTEAHKVV